MMGYPSERLREEVAYIAYYFHWPHTEIMGLDHQERRHWVREIASINTRVNKAAKEDEI